MLNHVSAGSEPKVISSYMTSWKSFDLIHMANSRNHVVTLNLILFVKLATFKLNNFVNGNYWNASSVIINNQVETEHCTSRMRWRGVQKGDCLQQWYAHATTTTHRQTDRLACHVVIVYSPLRSAWSQSGSSITYPISSGLCIIKFNLLKAREWKKTTLKGCL